MNKYDANEQREYLIRLTGGKCQKCGALLRVPQLAHRIPKHKKYLKKYGREVIHHPLNFRVVCSLRCNAACLLDPATHPIEAGELINKILGDLNGR